MAGSGLVFYTNPLAFHPAKVSVMLAEKKVPHRTIKVDIFSGPSLMPWFMRISPSSSVPALVHNGKVILESKVIVQYLDTLQGPPLGEGVVDRAVVDQFVEDIDAFDGNLWAFAHGPANFAELLKTVNEFKKKFAAARAKENPDLREVYEAKIANMSAGLDASKDPAKVAVVDKILADLLDAAEARLKEGAAPVAENTTTHAAGAEQFLGGAAYSVADALFAPILYRVHALGYYDKLIAPRPALAAYMKRVRARSSWNAAFGEASSTWGKLSNFVPVLLRIKVKNLLRWY